MTPPLPRLDNSIRAFVARLSGVDRRDPGKQQTEPRRLETLAVRGHHRGRVAHAVQRRDFDAWSEIYAHRVPDGARIVAELGSFDDFSFLSGRTHRAVPRVGPGVALVGDAAAAVHPHSGQGANLALEDGLALGAALVELGVGTSVALAHYARTRDRKLRRYVPWSIFIGRTFDGPNRGWRAVRRLGYVASRVAPARRASTRQQAGLG